MKEKVSRLFNRLKDIKKDSGKSYFSILSDFKKLDKKLNINFYEYYRFYLDSNPKLRETFLSGKNKAKFLKLINPRDYYILARNKYLSHLFFRTTDIQTAKLYLYYNPIVLNREEVCNDVISVTDKIKLLGVKEFVIKTTESSHGDGVIVVKDVHEQNNELVLTQINGNKVYLSEILKREPLIFESLVYQTEQFKSFNPTSVNTVRFMTLLYPNGEVKIMGTFIKIGRKGAWVDNAGSGGNICAKVDVNTGEISNVIEFNAWRKNNKITHHTDNQTILKGVKIENWNQICKQIKSYQKQMPFLKAIGWDVAITDKGAVIIEMNDYWDETGQLFIGEGWLQPITELYNAWKNQ